MSNFQIHELNSVAVNRNSNIIHDTEVSTDEWDTGKDIAGAVADLASANVAAPYDTTVTYAIGQYCLYEGNIYRCIAITTGAFDSTAWTQIVVTGEYRRVVELLSAQYEALTPAEQNNGTIYVKTDEETTAADIPYSAGVSVADKLDSVNTCETIYTQETYQNDLGIDRSIGAYDFRDYRVLRITLYVGSISSSDRVGVVIVNANASIGASYYPCVLTGTNGNIRISSTNNEITILASSFGNSICIGEIKGVR